MSDPNEEDYGNAEFSKCPLCRELQEDCRCCESDDY